MSLPRFLTLAAPAVAAVALLFAPGAADAGGGRGGGGGGYHGGYGYRGYGYRGYGYGYGIGIYLGGVYPYGYDYYGGYPGYAAEYYAAPYVAPAAPLYVTPPPPGPISLPIGNPGEGGLPQPQDLTAHLVVKVQPDAEVWFGQGKTRQTGATRVFVSPALTPGKEFTYEVKARWLEGGKEVVQTRQVDVSAGSGKTVDFTRPAPEVLDVPKPKP